MKDQAEAMNRFRGWASQKVAGAQHMNVGSGAQIRQLLFAGVQNQKPEKGTLETERTFKVGKHLFGCGKAKQTCLSAEVLIAHYSPTTGEAPFAGWAQTVILRGFSAATPAI